MKKIMGLLFAMIVLTFPVIGSCQSNQVETDAEKLMIKAEFIELKQTNKSSIQKNIGKTSFIVPNKSEAKINMADKLPMPNGKFKDIGIVFTITPEVIENDVLMKVSLNYSRLKSFSDGVPIILESETIGELRCNDGESIILGSPLEKVSTNEDRNNSVILVRITPTIINN